MCSPETPARYIYIYILLKQALGLIYHTLMDAYTVAPGLFCYTIKMYLGSSWVLFKEYI